MPRETSGRRNRRRRRRKNKERKTTSEEVNDPPKNESADSSQLSNSIDEIEECNVVENRETKDENPTENTEAVSTTSFPSTSKPFRPALVKPLPGLKAVLESVGGTASVFTRSEIMEYLVKYIKNNELYDVHNPRRVHCENDPLEKVFGCKEFSTANVCELLLKNLESVGEPDKNEVFKPSYSGRQGRKRKRGEFANAEPSSDSDSSYGGLPCTLGFWRTKSSSSGSESDATIEFPGTPCGEGDDAVLYRFGKLSSIGYETAVVTDSEDDLFYLEEECSDDRFSVEYEPVSEDEDERNESEVYMFDYISDDDDMGVDDDDDDDYDADTEIGEDDYWSCDQCSHSNHPMTSRCVSCQNVRQNWLESETDRSSSYSSTVHVPLLRRSLTAPPPTSSSSDLLSMPFPSLPRSTTIGPSPSIETIDNSILNGFQRSISIPVTVTNSCINSPLLIHSTSTSVTTSTSQTECITAVSSTGVANTPSCACGTCNALNFIPPSLLNIANPGSPRTLPSPVSSQSDSRDSGFCSGDGGAFTTPPVSDKPSSVQIDSVDSRNFNTPKGTCIVCLNKPRNASIIHGSTGHQVCCIRCAQRIKSSRNPRCPVCRKAIEHVIINFL